jgi:hypothetical protein
MTRAGRLLVAAAVGADDPPFRRTRSPPEEDVAREYKFGGFGPREHEVD